MSGGAITVVKRELGAAAWVASESIAPGRIVGDAFRVRSVLGTGGCATVYEAEHTGDGHAVAIKVPHDDIDAEVDAVARFARELHVAAMVEHENVLGVMTSGRLDDGRPYMAMELVQGESVAQRLLRGRLPIGLAIDITRQLLHAVSALAEKHIVHRDIKPANVMLDYADGEHCPRVKLIDFGIAKLVDAREQRQLVRLGSLIGTPQYMAPEQLDGSPVDERTDVYGCAAVLYEMLTGYPPRTSERVRTPDDVRTHRPDCPPALAELVARALGEAPCDRPRSARHMRAALSASESRAGRWRRARDFVAIPASLGLVLAALTEFTELPLAPLVLAARIEPLSFVTDWPRP